MPECYTFLWLKTPWEEMLKYLICRRVEDVGKFFKYSEVYLTLTFFYLENLLTPGSSRETWGTKGEKPRRYIWSCSRNLNWPTSKLICRSDSQHFISSHFLHISEVKMRLLLFWKPTIKIINFKAGTYGYYVQPWSD